MLFVRAAAVPEICCATAQTARGTNLASSRTMVKSGRILVVDDAINARTALAELLRDEGYDVETAPDAFKAIGKQLTFQPQLVITDLRMPGMTGLELVHCLRALDDPPAIIVITAFGAIPSKVEAMRAGATDYLLKPVRFQDLLELVDRTMVAARAQTIRNDAAIAHSVAQTAG